MKNTLLFLSTMLSFSVTTMALDYVCDSENINFSFILGHPARNARLLINDQKVPISKIEEGEEILNGFKLKGILSHSTYRSFEIFIENAMKFETVLKLENDDVEEYKIICTLIMI